jgi:23S rRNA pseudouridine1911/1915/1917 synthase
MVDLELEDDDYISNPSSSLSSGLTRRVELEMPLSCAGMRLDQALAALLPEHSRSRLSALIKESAVLVEGAPATAKQKVRGGETVAVTLKPRDEELAFLPEAIALDILHEDDAVMVINKPPGLVVHPAAGNWSGTLLNALLYHAPQLARVPRAGIVHRLDKDTSGLMVVAKTEAAQVDLVRQLQARSVKREYLALVQGNVRHDGSVDAPIGRHPRARTKMAVVNNGKPAVTHYRVLERFSRHTLLECRLETGRTHQIRVHMLSIGHAIEGDSVYGCKPVAEPALRTAIKHFGRQALHAQRLAFVHPVTQKTVSFEAPVPDDMQALIDSARGN